MSFADLERGVESSRSKQDEFSATAARLSIDVFKINANVTGISKLVERLGTSKDTPNLRKQLHDLTEVTRELAKNSTDDLKTLNNHPNVSPTQQVEQAKIARDFQTALYSFQKISKISAEKQKQSVRQQKQSLPASSPAIPTDDDQGQLLELEDQRPQQVQSQVQIEAVPDSELEYQEQLIEEREGEIRQIESGIHELNEIFRDLGTIVHEQQSMLDNIETNVNSIANDTEGASRELTKAHEYQRRAGRRMLCLLMVFVLVLSLVLIAVLA